MSDSPPGSFCTRCGSAVPAGSAFCPSCGAPVVAPQATRSQTAVPARKAGDDAIGVLTPPGTSAGTMLPTPFRGDQGGTHLTGLPTPFGGDAPTISGTQAVTNLDSPSPRPAGASKHGDGPFAPGQQISERYTVIRILGAGGMGAVYQAFDHELGVAVAIKVIRPSAQSDATAAKELEARFKRELVLARQVTHKYVVRIHDMGHIDGITYLTMPFVEGETLAQMLKRSGSLPIPRAMVAAKQIAQGLQAAHEKGVVHRDLKPENIMIEKTPSSDLEGIEGGGGDALIMDFGIARSMEGGATQTAAGAIIGTLEYMAPEQAQGGKIDQRVDIYAYGLIFYDMLVGRHRLKKKESAMTELLERLSASPPSPRSLRPEIPEPLDRLVMKCLAPKADDRFATTADLVQALDTLTLDGHEYLAEAAAPAPIVVQKPARPLWQLAAAGLLLAALAGGAGWMISNRAPAAPAGPKEPISVLIADFNNKTGDDVLNGVVEQALGLGVEGASFINVFSRRDALRAAAAAKLGDKIDEKTARLVAVREGVGLLLTGDIEKKGASYHITARTYGSATEGPPINTLEADAADKGAILSTVGALAGKVREALGDTAVPKNGPGANETFTAASIEAARAYAKAQELQNAGKGEEAIQQYLLTISLDPDMGRAYTGLAVQYLNLARTVDATKYYEEAMKHTDRMTEREKYRTRGSYYLFARKAQEAVNEYSALMKAYPADTAWPPNLAIAQVYLRHMDQALELGKKAAAPQPQNAIRQNNVAVYAMYASQFEAAIPQTDVVLKINPNYVKAYVVRALSELGLGRPQDAITTYGKLKSVSPAAASFAFAGLADVALYEGRTKDAIGILNDGIAADTLAKNSSAIAAKHIALGDAYLARGDNAAAAKEADLAIAADPSDNNSLLAGLISARAGKPAVATKLADALANKLENDPQAYAKLIRAEVKFAQGDARGALDLAKEAEKLADTWLGHLSTARIFLALNAFPEADSQLDVALKRRGEATAVTLDEVPTFRYFPQVYYYKGVAQQGLKIASAKDSFNAFLTIKEKGDETSGLVADAKKRVTQ